MMLDLHIQVKFCMQFIKKHKQREVLRSTQFQASRSASNREYEGIMIYLKPTEYP